MSLTRAALTSLLGLPLVALATHDPLRGLPSDPALNELAPAFTPDGRTLFLVRWKGRWGADAETPRTLHRAERTADGWTEPRPVAFSGTHDDDDPFVSPDGRYLYFVSNRPAPGKDDDSDDIFRVDLTSGGAPERLPPPINGPSRELSPVPVAGGHLYFASDRPGGLGQGDLYRAAWNGHAFEAPERLGPALNSPTGEWNLWVDPDERELIFEASSRPTNVSVPGDLYLSVRGVAGWSPALPLASLNTDGSDLLPRLAPDGRTLLYGSAPLGGRASIRHADWPATREKALASLARPLRVEGRAPAEARLVSLIEGRVVEAAAPPDPESGGRGPSIAVRAELVDVPAIRAALARSPLLVLLHAELPLAYVALPAERAVAEIDLVHKREVRRIDVGIEPVSLAWSRP